MVWPNLPPCHRFLYFVLLFSTKAAWQRGSKHYQRFYHGYLHQTMVDSWYCLDQVGSEDRSQVSALFGTMSIVKLFHSFEYRKILEHNFLWRYPLYSSTIFKSWIQLFTVSIFDLPNKSPPFRLSHFASEKLLNVYVLHSLDKQWLPESVLLITVLNDRKKRCVFRRIFICKQKTKSIHNFFGDNTRFTPGIEAWSRTTKKTNFHTNI